MVLVTWESLWRPWKSGRWRFISHILKHFTGSFLYCSWVIYLCGFLLSNRCWPHSVSFDPFLLRQIWQCSLRRLIWGTHERSGWSFADTQACLCSGSCILPLYRGKFQSERHFGEGTPLEGVLQTEARCGRVRVNMYKQSNSSCFVCDKLHTFLSVLSLNKFHR